MILLTVCRKWDMVEGEDKKGEREYEKNTLIIFMLFNGFNINGMWWIKWR